MEIMGFSKEQSENIGQMMDHFEFDQDSWYGSGGGHYHKAFRIKNFEWIIFHSVEGDITVSDPGIETEDDLWDLFFDDWERVTNKIPANFTTEDGNFGKWKIAVEDIKTNNFSLCINS